MSPTHLRFGACAVKLRLIKSGNGGRQVAPVMVSNKDSGEGLSPPLETQRLTAQTDNLTSSSGWNPNVRWNVAAAFSLGVGEHDRGIHIEHDQVILEKAAGDPRRRWSTGQVPHPRTRARSRLFDPPQPGRGESIQGAPHSRRRGRRPQHGVLVANGVDVSDRLPTTGEHRGHIHQHLATVMPRNEPTPRQGAGEFACQADLLRQEPHRNPADTITKDRQARSPRCTLHLPSAFPLNALNLSQIQLFHCRTGTLVHSEGVPPPHPRRAEARAHMVAQGCPTGPSKPAARLFFGLP